jgi:hypothetical protein
MEIAPFAEEHLDAAAELLAARHRAVEPRLHDADHRLARGEPPVLPLLQAWARIPADLPPPASARRVLLP